MPLSHDAAYELARLAALVLTEPDLDAALVAVAKVAAAAVPVADGASLMMRSNGLPTTPAHSDEWSAGLDELQFVEQEGPCVDALREGSPMRVRDLSADPRFPSYGRLAAARGALSAMSLPLAADGRTVGALDFYARTRDAFDAEALAVGELLAAHAAFAVQAAAAYYSHRDLAEQMRQALDSRAVIEQAKGVIMARQAVDGERAFEILRAESQHTNRKLRDVAADLVRRTQTR